MQILSGDLVTNGDFSQEGSELVTNGDFATDSDWNKGANWSILNGVATSNGAGLIQQSTSDLTPGKTYKISFEITEYTSGGVKLYSGSGSDASTYKNTVGTHTDTLVLNGSTTSLYSNNFIGSIDNVSVKEVGQDWEFSNDGGSFGWRIANERAICDAEGGGNGRNLNSSTTLVNGKTYKLTLDILQSVDGMNVLVGSTVIPNELPTGTNLAYEYYIEASQHSGGLFSIYGGSSDLQEIDNISVIEITDDTNLPRIDYTGGVGHWLFEPQSTNIITYSEDYSNSFYVKDSGVSVGTTNNSSPNINPTATKIDVTNNGRIYANIATNTYYSTVFIKSGTFSHFKFAGSNIDLIAETNSNGTIQSFGNGWYRIGIPYTGNRPFQVQAYPDGTYSNHTTSGNYFIWGTQSEVQSFATSYIPTNGAISTRLKDAAFGAGSSDLINSTEGVLYAEIAALNPTTSPSSYITISDGTYNNRASIFFSSGATNQIRTFLRVGGASQIDVSNNVSDVTDFNKIAFSYKENNFKVYINGALVSTDTSGSVWSADTVTKLSFSEINTSVGSFQGKAKCVAVFKEALTDAELTCLTTI